MNIGIIGAGNVGRTLGERFADAGHEVKFGVRGDSGLERLTHTNLSAGTVAEAAAFGQVIILATPWPAVGDAVQAAGGLSGKVVLDCVNAIKADFSGLELGLGDSAGERLAAMAPGAKVVKIFNTVGYNVMRNPFFGQTQASMLYCGDDAQANAIAAELASDIGFDPVDAGPLVQARYLEAYAWLWISMAMKYGHSREIAFKFLRR